MGALPAGVTDEEWASNLEVQCEIEANVALWHSALKQAGFHRTSRKEVSNLICSAGCLVHKQTLVVHSHFLHPSDAMPQLIPITVGWPLPHAVRKCDTRQTA